MTTFWNGRRAEDVARMHKHNEEGSDWDKFTRLYYRFHNDGDKPHHMAVKRLARVANVIVNTRWESTPEILERIGNGLLDS